MIRRSISLGTIALIATLAACTDNPTASSTPVGQYRLQSVGGFDVPLVLGASALLVRSGDMVLRSDNSAYVLTRTSASFPINPVDAYRIAGDKIDFTYKGTTVNSGTIAGDSIVMDMQFLFAGPGGEIPVIQRAVFRRTPPDPVAIREGTYVLTTVKNQPISLQPSSGHIVDYDTLRFSDGVFFRRVRQERFRDATGNTLGSYSYSWPGTYRGNAQYLLLGLYRDSSFTVAAPNRDSLIVINGALVLRTWAIDGTVFEDRYEKRP